MENTLENKAKFFAQYWGQKVMTWGESDMLLQKIGPTYMTKYGIGNRKLELKPLSRISDEELNNVVSFYEYSAYNAKLKEDQIHFDYMYGDLHSSAAIQITSDYSLDYLRSKGYALPFMGLSVEKQIEYGWIKLK